jgi:uncharacterized protein (TIGR03083 family)
MTTIAPRMEIRPISRTEAPALATAEYARFLDLVRSLEEHDWARPTDCSRWDVRAIVAHVTGWVETVTMRGFARVSLRGRPVARKLGGPLVDGMNDVLVRERAGVPSAQLVARLEQGVARAVAARASTPAPLRLLRIPVPGGSISLGFLNDHIFLRDTWIHRVDISRAVDRQMVLTPDHDGRIVADIVADWESAHRRDFTLILDGPAGGVYGRGTGGETHRLDAVEFCRIVSGRAQGTGLMTTKVLF